MPTSLMTRAHFSVASAMRFAVRRRTGQVRDRAIAEVPDVQVWSELFDGDDGEPQAFQDRITGRIANSIGREIFVAAARGGLARNIGPTSFDFLHAGTLHDEQSLARGIKAAETAVAPGPDNARAHCAMGLVHVRAPVGLLNRPGSGCYPPVVAGPRGQTALTTQGEGSTGMHHA